jgi:hypothetical protein
MRGLLGSRGFNRNESGKLAFTGIEIILFSETIISDILLSMLKPVWFYVVMEQTLLN